MTQQATTKTETLYRKYRPESFDQILGQSEVVDTLQNAIKSGSIAHAYLFSGGRGTGKTSIARIFARELGTSDQDMYEIDAASNRGINEIRELRDGVSTLPFSSQYKVYIIDEVHMLTKEAFNALLKTLEEPPAHVIFILATTEKYKVLDTIQSRCQCYDFKLAIGETLVQLVEHVCKEEGRTIDTESAKYIASLGKGSFRDTLSHLQKVFALNTDDISFLELQKQLGDSTEELEIELLEAISNKNQDAVFNIYQKIVEQKIDTRKLVQSLLQHVRSILMLRYSKTYQTQALEMMTQERINVLSDMSGITSHTLKNLLITAQLINDSAQPQESFEVFLFELFEKK